ncbi:MAG: Flp pilus assembly protein CpaB [Phenylobacterium sp.]|uniref:Flp pilus assembly protein CpaB n=1 Tax=Phenylobacterium sp. TaxID=1871053 RepID=UPI0027357D38|nr:Flp pilus assembly protein CpaB [Phenylobacterium sp.]MDP3175273.1 Flp pilus assembly protein CpaB [Phenylobacterium sp.]
MGAVRIAIIAIAGIAGVALAFLIHGMMAPKPVAPVAVAAVSKPMAQVLVAKKDLPIGWRITPADLNWQAWPIEALNANFITDGAAPTPQPKDAAGKVAKTATRAATDLVMGQGPMQAFEGAIVKEALMAGEPITARKVVRAGQSGYLSVVLQPGMRAMAIPVTAETGAGGFILPGDRVDVLQSRAQDNGGSKAFVTETLMQNLRVLAIDQTTSPEADAKTVVGAVATLEVPSSDAEVLARGKAQGEMILALRSYADVGGASGRGGPAAREQSVNIIRAGNSTEVAVR